MDKKRSRKRRRHTGRKVAGGAVLIALLLAGGHFGLGIGREDGGLLTSGRLQDAVETVSQTVQGAQQTVSQTVQGAQETVPETAQPVQQIVVPQDDGVLSIVVREDKLLYEGQEVTLAQLEEDLLRDYKAETTTVEMQDDHAIKAAYDEVHALLQKLSIPFTTGK